MDKTLQTVRMGDKGIMDNTINLFFRAAADVFITHDGAFNLRPENSYDFYTYFNSFSLKKWRKFTTVEKLFLEIDISGSFYIDLFGHYVDGDGVVQKEVLGKYFFDSYRRQKYTLEFPYDSLSEVVSFLIYVVEDDAKFYGGRYFTETDNERIMPAVSVDISETGDDDLSLRSTRILKQLCSNPEYKGRLFFRDGKKKTQNADYLLHIDPNAYIEDDSIKRICTFLSFLKDEYKDSVLSASVLDINRRNVQFKYYGLTDINPENEAGYETDLNNWDQVILNETDHERKARGLINSFYYCIPSSFLKKTDLPITASAFYDHEKYTENNGYNIVTLNGICAWGQESNVIIPDTQNEEKTEDTDELLSLASKVLLKKDHRKGTVSYDHKEHIQDILFQDDCDTDEFIRLFYRSDDRVHMINNEVFPLKRDKWYDFSTYFNSFSLSKWKKYTHIKRVFLELELSGSVYIELMGHYVDGNGNMHKEWLGNYEFYNDNVQKVIMPFPEDINSDVLAFIIYARDDSFIYGGSYFTDISPQIRKKPHVSLVTTTYKKENFVVKNIELINNQLFTSNKYKEAFDWFIIDNGNTLMKSGVERENIHLIENKNVGGAGGFSCGIMHANNYKKKPTHIVLMDDDVLFSVDSFKRLYTMLSLLRDEYKDHFISGAMLEMEARHIQHEDIGYTTELGEHRPCKPRYDLSVWDSVIRNEEIISHDDRQYAGWWFCCIPATIARNDNLPLPVFIRGDDIEYSHRNKAKFITMNGILIWHQGFTHKFSAALELYQVHRNDLVLNALGRYSSDIDIIKRMKILFREEICKFNYKGASLIADAIEDFMKGPKFLMSLKADRYMKKQQAKDNKLTDITSGIEAMIEYETLYEDKPMTQFQENIYKKTYNGHFLPVTGFKSRIGVIPYGWGNWPGKQYMASVIYAIDDYNHKYVKYEKSFSKFKSLTDRFSRLMSEYYVRRKEISIEYKMHAKEMTGMDFWSEYLRIE